MSYKLLASSDQIRPKVAESSKGMTREWAMVTREGWIRNVSEVVGNECSCCYGSK